STATLSALNLRTSAFEDRRSPLHDSRKFMNQRLIVLASIVFMVWAGTALASEPLLTIPDLAGQWTVVYGGTSGPVHIYTFDKQGNLHGKECSPDVALTGKVEDRDGQLLLTFNEVDLNAPVFKLLNVKPAGPIVDNRVWKITVTHLLDHAAGWQGAPL